MSDTQIAGKRPVVDQVFGQNKAPVDAVLTADFADLEREAADFAARAADVQSKPTNADQNAKIGALIADARDLTKRIDKIRVDEGRPLIDTQRTINAFFGDMAKSIEAAVAPHKSGADAYAREQAAAARAKAAREAQEAREREERERARAEAAKTSEAAANAERRAEEAAAKADRAEDRAAASAADLTRQRVAGVTASAKTEWAYRIADQDALYKSLGPVGNFLAEADVAKALRSMTRALKGRASVPGVEFYEDVKANFRR